MSSFEDDFEDNFDVVNYKFYFVHGEEHENELHLKGKILFNNVFKSSTLRVTPLTKTLYIKASNASIELINVQAEDLLGGNILSSEVVKGTTIYNSDEENYVKVQFAGQTPNIGNNSFQKGNIEYIYGLKQDALEEFLLEKQIKGPCWLDVTLISCGNFKCPSQIEVHPSNVNVAEILIPSITPTLNIIALDINFVVHRLGRIEPFFLGTTIGKCTHGRISSNGLKLGFLQMAVFSPTLQKLPNIIQCNFWAIVLQEFAKLLEKEDIDMVICHDKSILRENSKELYALLEQYIIIDLKLAADEFYSSEVLNDLQSLFKFCLQQEIHKPNYYLLLKDVDELNNDEFLSAISKFTTVVLARVAKYLDLANAIDIWSIYTLISNVTGCPLNKVVGKPGHLQRVEYLLKFEMYSMNSKCEHKAMMIIPEVNSPFRPSKQEISGGFIVEPSIGLHKDFVISYDFKALYPSIVREFNLYFTNNDRTLIHVMDNLIQLRQRLEQKEAETMQTDSGHEFTYQKSHSQIVKLIANSIYGCLCSEYSIFYHPKLGNAITMHGRQLLDNLQNFLKAEIECTTIYGHTDSLFINVNEFNCNFAIEKAMLLQTKFNANYKYIVLEFKGVYCRALILSKQKYVLFNSNTSQNWIIKGIFNRTIPKRCQDLCKCLLYSIVNDVSHKSIYDKTKELIIVIREMFKSENVEDYLMTVQLKNHPETYSLSTCYGKIVKRWNLENFNIYRKYDYVSYVICNDQTVNGSNLRAYNVEEYERYKIVAPDALLALSIDKNYYKKQLLKLFETILSAVPEHVNINNICDFLNIKIASTRVNNVPRHYKSCEVVNFNFQCLNCCNYIVLDAITCDTFIACSYCSELLTSQEQIDSIIDMINQQINANDAILKQYRKLEFESSGRWKSKIHERMLIAKNKFRREMELWGEQIEQALFIIEWYGLKSNFPDKTEEVKLFLSKIKTIIRNCTENYVI